MKKLNHRKKTLKDTAVCILCKETSKDLDVDPIAVVSYLQKSNSIQIAYRQSLQQQLNKMSNMTPEKSQKQEEVSQTESPVAQNIQPQDTQQLKPNDLVQSMLFKNFEMSDLSSQENATEIQFTTCSHFVHTRCYQRYFETLQKRHIRDEQYEGKLLIDLELGEFVCPVCRCISNALLPISEAKQVGSFQQQSAVDFVNWLKEIQNLRSPNLNFSRKDISNLQSSMETFAETISFVKNGSHTVDHEKSDLIKLLQFLNCIIFSIGHTSLLLQSDPSFQSIDRLMENLSFLGNSISLLPPSVNLKTVWENLAPRALRISSTEVVSSSPTQPESQKQRSQCAVCGKETKNLCSACKNVYYCSRSCQAKVSY